MNDSLIRSRKTSLSCYFLNKPLKKVIFSHSRRTRKQPLIWTASKDAKHWHFISRCADLMEHTNQTEQVKGLMGLAYIIQGVFGEPFLEEAHLDRIRKNIASVRQTRLVEALFNCV